MNFWQAILLGAVQGLTEFLPVSSSGHLLLAEQYLGVVETQLATIWLHFASLLAVIVFFRVELLKMRYTEWLRVAIATLPALVGGWFLKDVLFEMFGNLIWVGLALILTGVINLLINKLLKNKTHFAEGQLSHWQWLKIGLFQAFALLPGVSRSGSTILGGLTMGLDRQVAFRFSFILSIPAILAATGYELLKVMKTPPVGVDWTALSVAGVATFGLGYISLGLMSKMLERAKWWWFAVYPAVVGAIVLVASVLRI